MNKVNITPRSYAFIIVSLLIGFLQTPVRAYAEDGLEHENVTQQKTVYFPQFQLFETVKNEDYMLYGIVGKLVLRDECLRVMAGEREYLLIWPGWYEFSIAGREIVVRHLHTGATIAHLKMGDTVSFSGAELENNPVNLQYAIPDQCVGPFWAVGDIESVKAEKPIKKYKFQANKEPVKAVKKVNKEVKKINKPQQAKKDTNNEARKEFKKLEIKLEESILR
jgi:hypothetical protein